MKAFDGHNAIIQNNALDNWRYVPGVTVVLLGNDPGTAEAAQERGFLHIPDIAVSEYGTPQLNAMFAVAQAAAVTPFVCYINGDILLPKDFAETVQAVGRDFEKFLMIGTHWKVDITTRLPIDGTTCNTTALLREYKGEKGAIVGIDYFAFPTGMIDYMPEFYIGRPGWDNWLIWESKRRSIPVVDVSAMLTVLHQNHGYHHVPGGNGRDWNSGPESARHKEIFKAYPEFDPWYGTILHATHKLTSTGFHLAEPPPDLRHALIRDAQWKALQASGILSNLRQRVVEGV